MIEKIFTDSWLPGSIPTVGNIPKFDCTKMLCTGSCFARNILRWLEHHKITSNKPLWDILYNPFSILKEFERLYMDVDWQKWILEEQGEGSPVICRDPWRTWFSTSTIEGLASLNEDFSRQAKVQVEQASTFLITFGLSEIWSPKENLAVVLNQVPIRSIAANKGSWQHRLADIDETIGAIGSLVRVIREKATKDCPIIFTLSPVPLKHTAAAMTIREANNLSKATLLVAIRKVASSEPGVYYYPSYEIVQALAEQGRSVWQKDGRHVTASTIDFVSRRFTETQDLTIPDANSLSKFWVPLVNENGKIIGKLYVDETVEID